MAADPKDVALSYLKAFETKDVNKIKSLLHANGTFKGPMKTYHSADEFVAELRNFIPITKSVRIRRVFVDGNEVSVTYDYATIIPSIPVMSMSEWFKVEDGKIREQEIIYNPMPFAASMGE